MSASNAAWYHNRHRKLVAELKADARRVTRALIDAGYVRPRPEHCERCGTAPERPELIHCHHVDYFAPELIAWLCPPCHRAEHPRPIPWQRLFDAADHAA